LGAAFAAFTAFLGAAFFTAFAGALAAALGAAFFGAAFLAAFLTDFAIYFFLKLEINEYHPSYLFIVYAQWGYIGAKLCFQRENQPFLTLFTFLPERHILFSLKTVEEI
jgi:hypothetical protein